MAFNYDFIPEDKLDWKPAPTANSALEIAAHLVQAFNHLGAQTVASVTGANYPQTEAAAPTTREEAKQQILSAAQNFTDVLKTVKPEDLSKKVDVGFGVFPLSFLIGMPMVDVIHHHGQIAYIQSLLGDTESHFDMELLPK